MLGRERGWNNDQARVSDINVGGRYMRNSVWSSPTVSNTSKSPDFDQTPCSN
ncbi:unnamed protein product, partial [Nesidiocoris tenuis]